MSTHYPCGCERVYCPTHRPSYEPDRTAPVSEITLLVDKIETLYDFECEAGPLTNCLEWVQLKQEIAALRQERDEKEAEAEAAKQELNAVHERLTKLLLRAEAAEQARDALTALLDRAETYVRSGCKNGVGEACDLDDEIEEMLRRMEGRKVKV